MRAPLDSNERHSYLYFLFEEVFVRAILKLAVLPFLIFGDYKADVTELFPMQSFDRFNNLGDTVSLLFFTSHPLPLFLLIHCFVTTFNQAAHLYSSCLLFLLPYNIGGKYGSWATLEFWLPSLQDIAKKLKHMRRIFLLKFDASCW